MTLPEKILALYPELTMADLVDGYITLQNDSDGNGDYIAKWEHSLPKPTDEQLGIAPVEEVIETPAETVETPAETASTEGTE
jgi:hypothetical protein